MTSDDPAELQVELGPSISEEVFRRAVLTSGYPLQTFVAAALHDGGFKIAEEWAFTDSDTGQRRSLDLVAEHPVVEPPIECAEGSATALVALLIECKQSRHPYVLFQAVSPPPLDAYPPMTGAGRGDVELRTPTVATGAGRTSYDQKTVSASAFMGLDEHPFVTRPTVVSTISRAVASGKKSVDLSGEEPFKSLTLPLTKALDYYWAHHQGYKNRGQWHDLRLPLAVAVVDAPLVLVTGENAESGVRPVRCARAIVRRPPDWARDRERWYTPAFDVVDIVHRSFFKDWVDRELQPFMAAWRERLEQNLGFILDGRAAVASFDLPPGRIWEMAEPDKRALGGY